MNFKKVREMSISDLLKDQEFRDHYVSLFNTCHQDMVPVMDEDGNPTGKTQLVNTLGIDGDAHFDRETGYFKQAILDNDKLASCNALSVMTAFFDLAYHGISIEVIPKPEAYITPRKGDVPGAPNEKEWRATLRITGFGELGIRIRNGVLRHIDNPVMVYAGDGYYVNDGIPVHKQLHTSDEIIHAYVKITKRDGSIEYKSYSMTEIQAWRAQSDNPNGKAWTGGIPYKDAEGKEHKQPTRGMIETKVIKHSMNALPRIKLGSNTELAPDVDYEYLLAEKAVKKEAAYADTMSKFTTGHEDEDGPLAGNSEGPPATKKTEPEPEEDDPLADDSTNDQVETETQATTQPVPQEKEKSKRTSTKSTAKTKEPEEPVLPGADEGKVEIVEPPKSKRTPIQF